MDTSMCVYICEHVCVHVCVPLMSTKQPGRTGLPSALSTWCPDLSLSISPSTIRSHGFWWIHQILGLGS